MQRLIASIFFLLFYPVLVYAQADHMQVTTQPQDTRSGEVVAGPPTVTVYDSDDQPVVAGTNVSVSLNKNSFTGTSTTTVSTDASGNAVFSDVSIETADTDYQLTFSSGSLTQVASDPFEVVEEEAILSIINQPAQSVTWEPVEGANVVDGPTVRIVDTSGNPISGIAITATLSGGTFDASGKMTASTDASGEAVFDSLIINTANTGYQIVFSTGTPSVADVTSNAFEVVNPTGALTVDRQPAESIEDYAVEGPPAVMLEDAGNPLSGIDVTAYLSKHGFAASSQQTVATDASGRAVFENLIVDSAQTDYQIVFQAAQTGVATTASQRFEVVEELAVLTVLQQPELTIAGQTINGPPSVQLIDQATGNPPASPVNVYAYINKGDFSAASDTMATATSSDNGVATFDSLIIGDADTDYQIRFSTNSSGIADVTTNPFEVIPVAGTMTIDPQPTETIEGYTLSGPPTITILDAGDNPLQGIVVEALLNQNSFAFGTTTLTTNASGVASFDDLIIQDVATDYQITFDVDVSSGVVHQTSQNFEVVEETAVLTVQDQPSLSIAGEMINGPPSVLLEDASTGNPIANATVQVALNKGTFSAGTATVNTDASGVAVFDDLVIDQEDADYELIFSTGTSGIADVRSGAFDVIPVAGEIHITQQPTETVDGYPVEGPPAIEVLQTDGVTPITGLDVTASINQNNFTGTSTTTVTTDANGVAVFDQLQPDQPATGYEITFNTDVSQGVPFRTTSAFDVVDEVAVLTVQQQPQLTIAGETINGPPAIKLETPGGEAIQGGTIYAEVSPSDFTGTSVTSVTTNSNGVAVFDQLTLANANTGYELTFSSNSSGIAPATSDAFDVVDPQGKMAITQQPLETVHGQTLAGPPTVTLTELNGDPWSGSEVDVTVAVNKNSFNSGTLTQTTTNGVVVFDDLILDAIDTGYELTFSTDISERIPSTSSHAFDVVAVSGYLNITLQPSETVAGDPINGPPTVRLTDLSGDPVPDVEVTAALNKNTLNGAGTIAVTTNGNGEAVFDNLVIDDFDSGYELTFSTEASGVASVSSDPFEVTDASLSMGVTTQPQQSVAGDTIPGYPAVTITNAGGGVSGVLVTASLNKNGFAGASTLTATTNSSGVATFDELVIHTAATGYRIRFNADYSGVPNAESNPFEVTHAEADYMEVAVEPMSTDAGSIIQGFPTAVLYDAFGNPVQGEPIEVVPNQYTFTSGTTTKTTDNDGKAVFDDLVLTTAANNYQLLFTDNSGVNAASGYFAIQNGPPDHLSILTQPSETIAGAAISGPPLVEVEDQYGNPVSGETVTITEEGGYSIDAGTLSIETQENGQAGFSDLVIQTVGSGYQFRFDVGGTHALSNTFNVVPGTIFSRFHGSSHSGFNSHRDDGHQLGQTPQRIEIAAQPEETVEATAIAGPPEVVVYDATDQPVSNVDVTVSGPSFSDGTLTLTTDQAGHAVFSDLVIDGQGTYNLTFTVDQEPSVQTQSDAFDVIPALANMSIPSQPSETKAGQALEGLPTVVLENSIGMPVEGVDITVYPNQNQFDSGTTTVQTDANGEAVFNDLIIHQAATNYQLIFEADYSGVQNITSSSFDVLHTDADNIRVTGQPRETFQGATIEGPPVARVTDPFGNPVSGTDVSVSELLSGTIDAGTTTIATNENGQASFSNLVINNSGTYQLAFSSEGVDPANSNTFQVLPGSVANRFKGSSHSGFNKSNAQSQLLGQTPVRMEMVGEPRETVAGFPVEGPPVIAVYDATDRPVSNVQVTVQAVGGTLDGGTFTKTTDDQGQITFNDLVINAEGTYQLSFTADNYTSTVDDLYSMDFDVVAQFYTMQVESQPQNSTAGETVEGSPKVTITNFINQPLSGVEVTVYLNQMGFASGTTTLTTDFNGEAVFDDLVINAASENYQLIFDADHSGITNVNSDMFDVAAAEASELTVTTQPDETTEGAAIQGPPTVLLNDAFGNPISGETIDVTEAGGYPFDAGTTSLTTNKNGLASFGDLVINAIGTYSLTFSHALVSDVTSRTFMVQSGTVFNRFTGSSHSGFQTGQTRDKILGQTPARIEVLSQPEETVAGSQVVGPPRIVVYDELDNPVANVDITVSVPGGFKPGSSVSLTTDSQGEAIFDDLIIESTGSYQLSFTADNYAGITAESQLFDVISQQLYLTVTTQPGESIAGQAVAGHPAVQLANSIGQGYAGVNITVYLNQHQFASDPTTQTVTTDASGYAEFDQLVINQAAEGYQLLFDADYSGVLNVTSNTFEIVHAEADKLSIGTSPGSTESGATLDGPPSVIARDAYGNPVEGLNVSVAETGGYAFDGGATAQTTDAGGRAVFNDLVINTVGQYSLTYSAAGVSDLVSTSFRVMSGTISYRFEGSSHSGFEKDETHAQILGQTPSRLEILAEPLETIVSSNIEGPPQVAVYDELDNPVAGVTLRASVSGFFTSGSVSEIQTDASGEAVFDNLAIDEPGTYTLTFEAPGFGEVEPVNSQSFEVVNQVLHASVVNQPTESVAGSPVSGPPALKLENDFGQGFQGVDIIAHINQHQYSPASTDTVTTDASGVASFDNLILETASEDYQIIFEIDYSGVTNLATEYFDVNPAPASQMRVITQPAGGLAEAAISGPPSIGLYDDYDNPISNASVTVTESGGYPLDAGTFSQTTGADGISVFDDLVIHTAGTYILNFSVSAAGVSDVQSVAFDILPGNIADRFRGGSHSGFISTGKEDLLLRQVPARIVMITEPAQSVVGAPVQGPPLLRVYDQTDVPVTDAAVTASIVGGSPALEGTMTLSTDESGEVLFDDLLIDQTGTYQLHFGVAGYPDVEVVSREFEVINQTLSMSISQEPQNTQAGQVIGGHPAVSITNEVGQPAPAGIDVVVYTNQYGFSSDPAHDTVQTDASGLAVFDQLTVDRAANDYRLIFEADYPGVSSITSGLFDITPAPADHMDILNQPTDGEAGSVIGGPPTAGIFDTYGNPISGATVDVAENGGEPLNGVTSIATGENGAVRFEDLIIDNPGTYQLIFSTGAAGVDDAASINFNIISTGTVHRFTGGTHSGFISHELTEQPLHEPPEVEVPVFTVFEDTLCQGVANVTYAAEAANNDSIRYSITLPAAGQVDEVTGGLDLAGDFYGTFYIRATAYGYGGPKTDSLQILVEPEIDAPVFTDPVTEVCQGGTSDYTATAVHTDSVSYSVIPMEAGSINEYTGAMIWASDFSGSAQIVATAGEPGDCGGQKQTTVDVTVNPAVGEPVFTQGAIEVCQDAPNETYTATADHATDIVYSRSPAEAGIINSNTGEMDWAPDFYGTVTISARAQGQCNAPRDKERIVTVHPKPSTSGISGESDVACHATGETYSVDLHPNASYAWSVPAGATITSGATGPENNSIAVDFAENNGSIRVVETSEYGCVGDEQELQVTLHGCNLAANFTVSETETCEGGTVTFTDISTGNPDTWEWDFGTGAVPQTATGQGPHDVSYSSEGTYSVSLTVREQTVEDTQTEADYITVSRRGLWLGNVSSDWFDPGNWSCGEIPDNSGSIFSVIIQQSAPNDPEITSVGARVRDIEIENGATLNITNDVALNVYGNWYNNGDFAGDNSAVIFRGDDAQIAGNSVTSFDALQIAGAQLTAVSDSIDVQGDFIADGTFVHNDGIISFTGGAAQEISGTATSLIFYNMVIDKPSQMLQLIRHVDVSNYLTLTEGVVESSSSSILRIMDGAGADPGNADAFVDGPVQKTGNQAFTFPTGNNGVWAPIEITAPAAASDVFTARYFYQGHPEAGNDPCGNCGDGLQLVGDTEYWDLSRNNGSSTPDVTLYFKDMARSGISSVGSLRYAHWNGSEWVDKTLEGSAQTDGSGGCYITGTGFTLYNAHAPGEPAIQCPETGNMYFVPNNFDQ